MNRESTPLPDANRWLVEGAVAVLAGGRWMAGLSLVLAGAAAFALVSGDLPGRYAQTAASAALLLGVAGAYAALRAAMDLEFFRSFRNELPAIGATLASFDEALRVLGWISEAKSDRALAARVAGAQRLVRAQGILALGQAILVASIPWLR